MCIHPAVSDRSGERDSCFPLTPAVFGIPASIKCLFVNTTDTENSERDHFHGTRLSATPCAPPCQREPYSAPTLKTRHSFEHGMPIMGTTLPGQLSALQRRKGRLISCTFCESFTLHPVRGLHGYTRVTNKEHYVAKQNRT